MNWAPQIEAAVRHIETFRATIEPVTLEEDTPEHAFTKTRWQRQYADQSSPFTSTDAAIPNWAPARSVGPVPATPDIARYTYGPGQNLLLIGTSGFLNSLQGFSES